jgi:RNA polymerase sigma-70 factor (ECF subfamily)
MVQSEQHLISRAARGDEEAFRTLWSSHRDALYRYACWVLQDVAAAEDVVQECYLTLIAHPERFDPTRAPLRVFLLAIARNKCRSRWRECTSQVALEDQEPARDPGPLARLVVDETSAVLNEAVAKLPALQREAVFLFEFEGLTLEQAAKLSGVNVGTLKARLHRGRERLKRELAWLAKEGH